MPPRPEAKADERRLPLTEILVTGGLLLVIGFAAFGWYVKHGSFNSDDWSNAATYHFERSPRLWHALADRLSGFITRPIQAILTPIPHAVLGVHPAAHIAMGIVLGVLMCLAFYVFLRTVGLGMVHAATIAALTLIFPWADAVRLWPTAGLNTIAVSLALLGATISLRAIEREERGFPVARVAALVLFACSVLMYEMASGALLLLGALYLLRAARRMALRWWAVDIVVVAAALTYEGLTTLAPVPSMAQRIHAIPVFVRSSAQIYSLSLLPYGLPKGTVNDIFEGIALVVSAGVVVVAARRALRTRDQVLIRWLAAGAGSIVTLVAAYSILLGTYLQPAYPGGANRANMVAALGYTTLAYAVLLLAARLVSARLREPVVAAVLVALLGLGLAVRLGKDEAQWARAAAFERSVMASVVPYAKTLPNGSVIFSFGAPGEVAAGIPVFESSYDLASVVTLMTDNPSLGAYPVFAGVQISCKPSGIAARFPYDSATFRVSYRSSYFADSRTGRRAWVSSQSLCRRAVESFTMAPFAAP